MVRRFFTLPFSNILLANYYKCPNTRLTTNGTIIVLYFLYLKVKIIFGTRFYYLLCKKKMIANKTGKPERSCKDPHLCSKADIKPYRDSVWQFINLCSDYEPYCLGLSLRCSRLWIIPRVKSCTVQIYRLIVYVLTKTLTLDLEMHVSQCHLDEIHIKYS